ncbi:MAG: ribbon-helix-helix domain-containing protein [Advenella sp.]|uniref:Aryl-sulfate sulfotransferase n=1 Tax=Advenella kashmirensis TaxID=310575 RepID=A0A356LJT5_9BURK|nr:ribbon-helix-helix domain-containing protein [Advenella sp. FME57]HBP31246.1 aryl-sulfate sulfotransferase [Advenella kashmirensis]
MCSIYSHTDPIMYECRSRSVRIAKVVTSIKLENMFWEVLAELARRDGTTTNQLIATLYDEVYAYRGEATNFTSFLRVTCMRYQAVRYATTGSEQAAVQTCTPLKMAHAEKIALVS